MGKEECLSRRASTGRTKTVSPCGEGGHRYGPSISSVPFRKSATHCAIVWLPEFVSTV